MEDSGYFFFQFTEILANQLFQWTRWRQEQSHDTNHKPPHLYKSAVENNNSTMQAKFSKLRCEHLFKPKLAKLPNSTNTSLYRVPRVHNLILHPEPPTFWIARQGSSLVAWFQLKPVTISPHNSFCKCHVQKDPPNQLHTTLEWPDTAWSQSGLQDKQDDSIKNSITQ